MGSWRAEEELGDERIDKNPRRWSGLWDMMVHVVNHGTQHQSEAAMVLTSLGRSPGDLDFLDFVDEKASEARQKT